MRRRLRILVIDEPNLVRDGVCALLGRERELEAAALDVGALASTAGDATQAAGQRDPDVVIFDFASSPLGIDDSIAAIRHRWSGARLLVVSFRQERSIVEAALRAGVDGYLLKTDQSASLLGAVRALVGGRHFMSPSMAHDSAGRLALAGRAESDGLSNREREVMKLIAQGYRTRDIAQQLSLSHKTIEKHRSNLMRKLGLKTAPAVAAFAISNGYLPQR